LAAVLAVLLVAAAHTEVVVVAQAATVVVVAVIVLLLATEVHGMVIPVAVVPAAPADKDLPEHRGEELVAVE
jgi:hypothetical protein